MTTPAGYEEFRAKLQPARADLACIRLPKEIPHLKDLWTAESVAEQRQAADLCNQCPALMLCRQYGLNNPNEWGVYGGLTQKERTKLRPSRLDRKKKQHD